MIFMNYEPKLARKGNPFYVLPGKISKRTGAESIGDNYRQKAFWDVIQIQRGSFHNFHICIEHLFPFSNCS